MTIRFPNLNFQLQNVPRTFFIQGYEFTMYGALLAAGMLLGMILVIMNARRKGKSVNQYLGMTIFAIIGGFLGARAFYVGFSWQLYRDDFMKVFDIQSGGMAFFGALFGGILFGLLYCLIRHLSFMEMADTLVLGLLAGQIVGRWGDFFNRGSFGEYADHYLAMALPLSSVRAGEVTELMRENLTEVGNATWIQVNPTFLYESLLCLVLLLFLFGNNRRKAYDGELFIRYLTGYGLIRFGVQWLRTDKMLIPGTSLDINLIIAGALFVIFFLAGLVKGSMAKKRNALKRQSRERYYQEEERIEAEVERREQEAARRKAEKEEKQAEKAEEKPEKKKERKRYPDDIVEIVKDPELLNRRRVPPVIEEPEMPLPEGNLFFPDPDTEVTEEELEQFRKDLQDQEDELKGGQ